MDLETVTNAEYKNGYKIFLFFNDGVNGIVDLSAHLEGEIFIPLKK